MTKQPTFSFKAIAEHELQHKPAFKPPVAHEVALKTTKTCIHCQEEKPLKHFHKQGRKKAENNPDRERPLRNICSSCRYIQNKKMIESSDPEAWKQRRNEYQKRYRANKSAAREKM